MSHPLSPSGVSQEAPPSPAFTVHGIEVKFPYKPYEPQKKYVEHLLEALLTGRHALLESPTGTGKTICLLCGALAWQRAIVDRKVANPCANDHSSDSEVDPPSENNAQQIQQDQNTQPHPSRAWDELAKLDATMRSPSLVPTNVHSSQASTVQSTKKTPPESRKKVKKENSAPLPLKVPTIFYSSRTHSQLTQVIGELRKTSYLSQKASPHDDFSTFQTQSSNKSVFDFFERREESTASSSVQPDSHGDSRPSTPSFRLMVTVLGSKDHLCIHPQLAGLRGAALNSACRQKLRVHKCQYEGGLSRFTTDLLTTPRDIEDLRRTGRRMEFCPYYAAKDNHKYCQLVLLPYDYLLSLVFRKQIDKFSLRNSVIIFDEGHNIESAAESAGSFKLSRSTLEFTIAALEAYRSSLLTEQLDKSLGFQPTQLKEELETPLQRLHDYLETVKLHPPNNNNPTSYLIVPTENFLSILTDCGFASPNMETYDKMLSKCSDWAGNLATQVSGSYSQDLTKQAKAVSETLEALTVALSSFVQSESQWFRIYICSEKQSNIYHERVLSFLCLSAGVVLKNLVQHENIHCLVITSGTLSPIDSYAQALGGYGLLQYPVQLINDHVVKKEQISLQILSRYNNQAFNLAYNNRGDVAMLRAIGNSACRIIRNVPGGVLVFFSSYAQMDSMVKQWRDMGEEWHLLGQIKKIFLEPNAATQVEFDGLMEEFKNAARKENIKQMETGYSGAVIFAVARGRISEGMNLSDDLCRCVVVIGVPHPALKDQKIQLKQSVLDEIFPRENKGKQWYLQQAGRAVNQAIGRVIRHVDDYGLVVLVDQRFESQQQLNQLSKWILPSVRRQQQRSCEDIINDIKIFFGGHYKHTLPKMSEVKKVSREIVELEAANIPPPQKCSSRKENTSSSEPPVRRAGHIRTGSKGIKATIQSGSAKRLSIEKKNTVSNNHSLKSFFPTQSKSVAHQLLHSASTEKIHGVGSSSSTVPKLSEVFEKELKRLTASQDDQIENGYKPDCKDEETRLCQICQCLFKVSHIRKSRGCGHSACLTCWQNQFKTKFECPFCRRKTRTEHLTSFTS